LFQHNSTTTGFFLDLPWFSNKIKIMPELGSHLARPQFNKEHPMARQLRLEYPGAIYHVTSRGKSLRPVHASTHFLPTIIDNGILQQNAYR